MTGQHLTPPKVSEQQIQVYLSKFANASLQSPVLLPAWALPRPISGRQVREGTVKGNSEVQVQVLLYTMTESQGQRETQKKNRKSRHAKKEKRASVVVSLVKEQIFTEFNN